MANLDAPEERAISAAPSMAREVGERPGADYAQTVPLAQAARFLLEAPIGSVISLDGVDGVTLLELVDQVDDAPDQRRVLLLRLSPAATAAAYVEQVIAAMATTAIRLWPCWFTDVSFAMCRDDTLGRQAAIIIAREAAARVPGVSTAWSEAAAVLALSGRSPRVPGTLPAVELTQVSHAISRFGLVLVVDLAEAAATLNTAALVHALEWVAHQSHAAVIALFAALPSLNSPFERILYRAHRIVADADPELAPAPAEIRDCGGPEVWLAPWRGAPHPLSEIEQRLAAMLRDDAELAALFYFNLPIDTVRGSRPKVDLVWPNGRLVVELDGYPDHTTRRAFIGDRHRDYELMLSGFTVLRLANEEVAQDFGRAIEKIRDLVRLRRSQMKKEG
jgi:very-short-patch-repair endonuclease